MIKINKVTTKTGDGGKTYGQNGKLIDKASIDIEFLGWLDHANCSIGKILLHTHDKELLEKIQHQIFDIGAMFYKNQCNNCEHLIEFLENTMQKLNQNLPELTSFLLPNGSEEIIALHEARCIVRHAERAFWKTKHNNLALIGIYLNRLSDLVFILVRKKNYTLWNPNRNF
jgi:cob(I)alamin adenosyltransferase